MIYLEDKKVWVEVNFLIRDVIKGIVYIDDNYIEYGYFYMTPDCVPIYDNNDDKYFLININQCKCNLYWSNSLGLYVLKKELSNNIKKYSKHTFNYPINRCYNFCKLSIIPNKINVELDKQFLSIKNYTIGLEYETYKGNIPWLDCRKYNLVPLYDGSIKGHEYVTYPLNMIEAPLIKDHLFLLNKYTSFDKDCSLHVHFGGFPIDYNYIKHLCDCWKTFQYDIENYIAPLSFNVELYKSNGKAYNQRLNIDKLKDWIYYTTGNIYESNESLYLPNRNDEEEEHKWQVKGRYFNMNIMHLISGQNHKTVEFRFLHPTKYYFEIKWFILILGFFLNYSSDIENIPSKCTVDNVINMYSNREYIDKLLFYKKIFRRLNKIQYNNDKPGINNSLKDFLFKRIYKL